MSYEEFISLRGAKEVERREGFLPKKKKKNFIKIVTVGILFGVWFITDFVLVQLSIVSLVILSFLIHCFADDVITRCHDCFFFIWHLIITSNINCSIAQISSAKPWSWPCPQAKKIRP